MEPKRIIRILPSGEQEIVAAISLVVGDRFIDEELHREGIVHEGLPDGRFTYTLPDGTISLVDVPKP